MYKRPSLDVATCVSELILMIFLTYVRLFLATALGFAGMLTFILTILLALKLGARHYWPGFSL